MAPGAAAASAAQRKTADDAPSLALQDSRPRSGVQDFCLRLSQTPLAKYPPQSPTGGFFRTRLAAEQAPVKSRQLAQRGLLIANRPCTWVTLSRLQVYLGTKKVQLGDIWGVFLLHIGDIWGVYVTKQVRTKSSDGVDEKRINRALTGQSAMYFYDNQGWGRVGKFITFVVVFF